MYTSQQLDAVFFDLKGFTTQAEALSYFRQIPPKERSTLLLQLNRRPELRELPYIGKWDGYTGSNTLVVSTTDMDGPEFRTQEAVSLYTRLFEEISTCFLAAKQAGRPFHLVCGEGHLDRNNLLVELMALKIAARLGVRNLKLEYPLEDSADNPYVLANGRKATILGLDNTIQRLRKQPKESICESDPEYSVQPDSRNINMYLLMHYALHNMKAINIEAIDPNEYQAIESDMKFEIRDPVMAEKIAVQEDSMTITGHDHLHGIKRCANEIVTMQARYSVPLFHPDEDALIGWNQEKALFPADIALEMPGKGVSRAREAIKSAEQADRIVGDKLCEEFFRNHSDIAPASGRGGHGR